MGHRITRAASHLSGEEVKERMKTEARPWVRQHWWIIYNALVAPRKAEEIALHTGVSATTVLSPSSPGITAWDPSPLSNQKKADAVTAISPSSKNRPFYSRFLPEPNGGKSPPLSKFSRSSKSKS